MGKSVGVKMSNRAVILILLGTSTVLGSQKLSEEKEVFCEEILNKINMMEEKMLKDEAKIEFLEQKIQENETKSKKIAVCGYTNYWQWHDIRNDVIQYDSLVAEVNEFNSGSLTTDGYFTAPVTGLYEVSAAGNCGVNSGVSLGQSLSLWSNNKAIEPYFMGQSHSGAYFLMTPCSGFRYVHLEEGDNLYLQYTGSHNESIGEIAFMVHFKFCVSIITQS